MKTFRIIYLLVLIGIQPALRAEEGMWLPALVESYSIMHMQELGLQLEAQDIYSINQACLKDAIVHFGSGCTGSMISAEGLLLTNHHCGEDAIHAHSTLEHNYLRNGFWAAGREEELPNPGLSVSFLRYMEDVTARVEDGLEPGMDPEERERSMDLNRGELIREATEGSQLHAEVRDLYYGNSWYLFVYEKFEDVRLVGAPPSSIGNFGGDPDNWMWPRHTGDFSLFRVYAGKDNQPAAYDPGNVPYVPRRHLEISTEGVREGDFTMVLGYPARSSEYLYSEALRLMLQEQLPLSVRSRTTRLELMDRHMKASEKVALQYAHKYRRVSNAWKKWQGMIKGMERAWALELKAEEERAFVKWMEEDGERMMKYDQLMNGFSGVYEELASYITAEVLMKEAITPPELFQLMAGLRSRLFSGQSAGQLTDYLDQFYKDFHLPVDRDVFGALMETCRQELAPEWQPELLARAEDLYDKSLFTSREKVYELADAFGKNPDKVMKRMDKDPLYQLQQQFKVIYRSQITPVLFELRQEEEKLYKGYMAGLLEQYGDSVLYPDANRTMRLAYGTVASYEPADGVLYLPVTGSAGLLEKYAMDAVEYEAPERLLELFREEEHDLCFIATNHTSGGNSGSPVLDAKGQLIGLNFDRVWEGTMSDLHYDPSLCRNISVDIRYVLFIIDQFAGAGHLLEEMDIR